MQQHGLTGTSHIRTARRRAVRTLSMLVTAGVALAAVGVVSSANPVAAAPAALEPRPDASVTADALPTVQVDGVVWSQAIVGNVVFAGGSFQNARPAGAAAGTNLTHRGNLLAFDITTGELITSFAPELDGQVMAVAASPDGTRIYVTGDFQTADGQTRNRLAAYDTATGQLTASFAPRGPAGQGRALAVTNDTVYVGGGFVGSGLASRGNMLAVRASDGALLNWNPDADYTVWSLALSQDHSTVYAGGSFQNVGGQAAYGMAKIDASTGAVLPWNGTTEVRDAGTDSGVTSLRVADGVLYGTGYHFGAGGNLEGAFALEAATGNLVWALDCHGDTYSTASSAGSVYVVGHSHYCGNVGGGWPQPASWNYQRALALSTTANGTNLHEPLGYPKDWYGKPSPSIRNWLPTLWPGTITGQAQAAWSVVAAGDYVVLGGEFPKVNGVNQQGLVRFAKAPVAPSKQGPLFDSGTFVPKAVATSTTTARITWKAAYDRDDQQLTYKVIRDAKWGSPVATTTAASNWWTLPPLGVIDSNLTPGQTYKYQVIASDASGNAVYSNSATITMPTTDPAGLQPYDNAVLAAGAQYYWPLTGTSPFVDTPGFNDATGGTTLATGQAGIDAGASVRLDGASSSRITTSGAVTAPDEFTVQAWIKTSTTSGGRIVGFGDNPTGDSNHSDRALYMLNDGRIAFGVWAGVGRVNVVSGASYNDNAWHQVTATFGQSGMTLYVDGARVATHGEITKTDHYVGYWRIGGDNLANWPNKPSKNDFTGNVDDVAVYPSLLTQDQIVALWVASGRTSTLPVVPADAYGAAVRADQPILYWRLGEPSGSTVNDTSTSRNPGKYLGSGLTYKQAGAIAGTSDWAVKSSGLLNTFLASDLATTAPQVYSEEIWFKSTSTSGGLLIGFGNSKTGNSGTTDRLVYMQNDGKLVFGVANGSQYKITTAKPYNNGQWHHVVATQSSVGMRLYADGLLVGTNPQASGASFSGYWRVAGDTTWGSTSRLLAGTFDEAAVYPTALSASAVAQHYSAAGGTSTNQAPVAAFTSSTDFLVASFDGTGSSDVEGPVTYSWSFGDGSTGTGAAPSHTYGASGTFQVALTVTDSAGAIASIAQPITVAGNVAPVAAFTSSAQFLVASFDGTGSSDAEGPVASYAWNFGDGSTGSGATASHTYAAGGSYNVTLTVTDGEGATTSLTQPITVAANQAPVAAFTSSTAFLVASFDGTGSSDSEGPVASYAWNFGDGSTGSGATASHTYAAGGSYNVTLTVTDAAGATTSLTQPITVAANQAPVAAFTSSALARVASFNGSGSSDADGSIVGYAWNFGDGSTGSGATASHTYAAGGSYDVTLTVTDGAGATASLTQPITVAANQAPVPAFTSSAQFLVASFNGSGSSDADGSIVGYAWNFGDGSTGSGATAAHTYAAGGSYSVTLTVTDGEGATTSLTQPITVAGQQVAALDTMSRTSSSGWGTADLGGVWTTSSPATNFTVANGAASMVIANLGGGAAGYLNSVSALNVDVTADVAYNKVATGGGFYTSLIARRIGTSDYRVKVRALPASTELYLARTVNGVETVVASRTVAGVFQPGSVMHVRFQVIGSGTATLTAKAWFDGTAEPAAAMLTATDTTTALQAPGAVGVYGYLSGSATNAPYATLIDNFRVGIL